MHKNTTRLVASPVAIAFALTCSSTVLAAPTGAHPRLWLDSQTQLGLAEQAGVADSPVARGAARCSAARNDPSEYEDGGWQGFEFVLTLSSCLISWEATHGADDLATAIKYWQVLLDDYSTVGDGAGGDDVVTHDTGYAMRTFAPYSAIAYDWLHDAPGVSETLRAHARARFDAWVTYYTDSGYLRHMAGANYQAGYAFAATLIAIAEAGEAGAAGDAHWSTVSDTIWSKDLVPAFASGGVLAGGDWPEGWQYGPLSVTEYALAARAMQENGTTIPGAAEWADSLVTRFFYGLTPATQQAYAGGDSDNESPYREPNNGALVAALAGPASDAAKAWARTLNDDLELRNENALFDALAQANGSARADRPASLTGSYLAPGTSTWYLRSDFGEDSLWSVFQCSRRLVDDHQHNDAGNWVLTRGADDVVVDPSPYGTLSTLTGNAPAVDSGSVPDGYSPSQGYWGESTGLRWVRQSTAGIAVARCDYADQFRYESTPSDVAVALRDFVLVPDGQAGEVVLIDRVVTGAASRGLHLRVRSPGALSLADGRATAEIGATSLAIERVWSSSGTPSVREMPVSTECPSSDHACDVSRIPSGTEYRLDVNGPEAMAIHAVSARAQAPSPHRQLTGDGYRGVVVDRAPRPVAIVSNDAPDGVVGAELSYRAPGNAIHVVVDAPTNDSGRSDVTVEQDGADCVVTVRRGSTASDGYDGAPLVLELDDTCAVADGGSMTPPDDGKDPPSDGGSGGEDQGANGAGRDDGGQASGSGSQPMEQGGHPAAGGVSAGTGGANGGTGNVAPLGGGVANQSGSPPSAARIPPTAPAPSACSVNHTGQDGGPAGSWATLIVGFWLTRRKRRSRIVPR